MHTPRPSQIQKWIALLGRPDKPADGVEDYGAFLAKSLGDRGIHMELVRVRWMEDGWLRGLWELWRRSAPWRGQWIFLQYTALAWSNRGFPFRALATLAILRFRRTRCAVVFHEPSRQREISTRWVDWIRGACQDWVIRRLYRGAEKAIFTVPLEGVGWLPKLQNKAAFIPIGGNVPERISVANGGRRTAKFATVVVFCFSPGPNRSLEVEDVVTAIRMAREEEIPVRLILLGRGSAEVRDEIQHGLARSGTDVSVLGLVSADEVSNALSAADAQLFVSGYVSQRRGSVLAGIACGLPVVGYAGRTEGTQIERAGLYLVPYRDAKALGAALVTVLKCEGLATYLRARSCEAHSHYFSWTAIASEYIKVLETETARNRLFSVDPPGNRPS